MKIVSLRKHSRNLLDRMTRIAWAAYKVSLGLDADVYHIHDPELLFIAVLLKKKGKKVIFDSHEFTALQILTKSYIPRPCRNTISGLYSNLETWMINELSGFIMPCTLDGKDYWQEVRIPKETIRNFPIVEPLADSLDIKTNIKEKKVCYLGAMSDYRGIVQMIKACSLAGRKLMLVGPMNQVLRKKIESMPEYGCVEFLGKLPHERALIEATKCEVGLCLLQNVGQYPAMDILCTKQYEYMMLGLPQVMSDFNYTKKILEKYNFGLAVDPLDINLIAEAINRIIEDDRLRDHMIEEGKKAVANEMNWETESRRLISFYHRVLDN